MADDIFWNSFPKKEPDQARPAGEIEKHWSKTRLEAAGKRGQLVVLKSDKLGVVAIKWENKDAVTKNNLTRIIKGATGEHWHVQWFEAEGGTKFVLKIMSDEQYSSFIALKNQNRKLIKHGFATQNTWLT